MELGANQPYRIPRRTPFQKQVVVEPSPVSPIGWMLPIASVVPLADAGPFRTCRWSHGFVTALLGNLVGVGDPEGSSKGRKHLRRSLPSGEWPVQAGGSGEIVGRVKGPG